MFLRRLEREIMIGLGADRELFAAFETVERIHRNFPRKLSEKWEVRPLINNFSGASYTDDR
jgi:hypothetical protein